MRLVYPEIQGGRVIADVDDSGSAVDANRHVDPSTGRRVANCVADQIDQDRIRQRPVDGDHHRFSGRGGVQGETFGFCLTREPGHLVGDQLVEVHRNRRVGVRDVQGA